MSTFSSQVKTELCRAALGKPCCVRAEAYGILLHTSVFSPKEIRIASENDAVIRRAQQLFEQAFGLSVQPVQQGRKRLLQIAEPAALRHILEELGYDFKPQLTYHLNRNILEDCCLVPFLRGAFYSAGTVAGPGKKSHLELKNAHRAVSLEVMSLLLDLHFAPKITERTSGSLLYFKDSAQVEDLLTLLGASHAAMELMEAKVEKTLRNNINRQVNCETANLVKAADASARQIVAIKRVLARHGDGAFPEALRETVQLRLQYPTDSLAELAARFSPPLSKPGLSHRLKKIQQIAALEE